MRFQAEGGREDSNLTKPHSELKSATQIYVKPINFELQLFLKNDLFSHKQTLCTKIRDIGQIAVKNNTVFIERILQQNQHNKLI